MAMTKERAEEIRRSLAGRFANFKCCATPEEDIEIRTYWDTLPGHTSYFTAVCEMARGKHLPKAGKAKR